MRPRTLLSFAALLGLVFASSTRTLAVSYDDLAREVHEIKRVLLGQATNELAIAKGRFKRASFELADKSTVRAYVLRDLADKKLDEFTPRIKTVEGSGLYTAGYNRERLTKQILLAQTQLRQLEDDLLEFADLLQSKYNSPLLKAYLAVRQQFRTGASKDMEDKAKSIIEGSAVDDGSIRGLGGAGGSGKVPSSPKDELEQGPDGMSAADAQAVREAAESGDVETLRRLAKKYPNNQKLQDFVRAALEKLAERSGLSATDARKFADAVLGNDAKTLRDLAAKYPQNDLLRKVAPAGGGGGGAALPMDNRNVVMVGPDGNPITVPPDWERLQWKNLADGTQSLGPLAEARYAEARGGRLIQEIPVYKHRKLVSKDGDTFKCEVTEERKDPIQWTFKVQAADGQYELVDVQGKKGFKVRGWELLRDGKTVDKGQDAAFKPKFVEEGTYEIRAGGETDMGSPFVIAVQVDYTKK